MQKSSPLNVHKFYLQTAKCQYVLFLRQQLVLLDIGYQNKGQADATPENTRCTIGKCSCQQNRLKFQTRRAQLLSTYSRLTSAGSDNSCLNHMLTPVSPVQHKARAILEEVLQIDLALEARLYSKKRLVLSYEGTKR